MRVSFSYAQASGGNAMTYLVFGAVFLLVMAAANFYIYRRFFRRVTPSFGRYAMVIPAVLMLGEVFFILDAAFSLVPDSPAVYFITSSFVGFTFMLFVVTTVYDLTITISGHVPFDQSRRRTLKIIFDVTMLIAAAAYLLRGLSQGLRDPDLNTIRVKIKDFPFERFTIMQLTDIHVGRTIKRDFIQRLVDRTNAVSPDMVVITGDLVDLPIEKIKLDLLPLRELKAKTYFILGNHEYFHGAEAALAYIRELGIQPLLNESVVIEHEGRRFNLIGINDLIGTRMGILPPDIDRAFSQVDEQHACIVLAHQPKTIRMVDTKRCDLMLSGHTHGGQIFPFGYLVMMDQPYLAGLFEHAPNRHIFVSRGTGYWGPPLRVLAPSEITQIVLSPATVV